MPKSNQARNAKKAVERRTYYSDDAEARRQVARWEVMYPWYRNLRESVLDELRGRDKSTTAEFNIH